MNILFVITRADAIGGAQVHVQDLAIALQEEQHKVLVLTGQKGIYNEILRQAGIESISCEYLQRKINPVADGKSFRYILHIIDLFKPDLIAAHSSKAGILGRLASKLTKVPCVFTAHGWSFTPGIPEPSRTIFRWLERLMVPLTEKVICVSEFDRQIGFTAGMNPQQLLTVHNGMKDVVPILRANPAKSDPIKIAMVARFDEPKDHSTLIKAVQDLDAQLILVGDGPNLPIIRQHVEQLGITKKVAFLGFRQDVAKILAEVQIFTLISKFEALPCTIIEAMRAGLPVVVSDVGGVKEIVIDNETGYVIPRNDTEKLRQKLSYLIDNDQERSRMGKLARQKYESELTFKHMYDRTLTVYQEIVAQKS
ncbi:glycosyltransferase family 4 protein [Pleurocapsa sp. PCC 7319]|uniref:glycosyltransferase family 4 protein n=1 Tax=Pleurocapsa sp. PCC 7319 TaxID=118161 RepID=UPI0003473D78|nr:glycosyltransferase family 4 protein [Pleurocapsa sp. PCC 7319]